MIAWLPWCGPVNAIDWPRLNPSGNSKKKANQKSKPTVADTGSPESAAYLKVGTEMLHASDIWSDRLGELETLRKNLSPADLRAAVERRSAELITDAIAEHLLYQKAALRLESADEKKIDAIVDSEVRKIVTSEYGGVQRKFERELQAQGKTIEDVRRRIRRSVLIAAFLDAEIKPKVPEPTRAELLAAFQQNRDSWRKPTRKSMSLINVRVSEFLPPDQPDLTDEDRIAARNKAREHAAKAHADLLAGIPFAEVARKYSHDGRALEGGRWGFVTRESVRERLYPALDVLDQLQEGQISSVIESGDDFFIVRCDEVDQGVEPDFQTAQPQLRDYLVQTAYNAKIVAYIGELRKAAKIEPESLTRFHTAVVELALKPAKMASP